jgi:hypothetical protein
MKLRIKGASLRLRLTQKEVHALAAQGLVEEHVPFGGAVRLIYRLRCDAAATEIRASFTDGVLEICVPRATADSWCASDQVTLAHAQAVSEGALQITLEKDFACLARRAGEDESDNFPHPQAGGGLRC